MESVYSASPSLSTSISASTVTKQSAANASNYNYGELFDDIDWQAVNLIDIEKDWREELEQLEKVLFCIVIVI